MLKYKEYEAKFVKPGGVKNKYRYFGYKNGESKVFDTKEEAVKFSDNIEKFLSNKEEMDAYSKAIKDFSTNVYNAWLSDLREEHSELTDKQFQLCYDEAYDRAYDRGHSYGHDEVVSYMTDVVIFAKQLLDTN
jgi:hypothetical protein